jgi:hypothetical protein
MSEEVTFRARLTAATIRGDAYSIFAKVDLFAEPLIRGIKIQLAEVPEKGKAPISKELGQLLATLVNDDGSHSYVDVTLRPAKDG